MAYLVHEEEEEEITAESTLKKWHERQKKEDKEAQKWRQLQEDALKEEQLALKSERDFYLRRRYFLRKYTHAFLGFDIYSRFDDYFTMTVSSAFDESEIDEAATEFLVSIFSHEKAGKANCSLLDQELGKDLMRIQLGETPEYISADIEKDDLDANTIDKLKKDIAGCLVEVFFEAEAYRYVIGILKDDNFSFDELTKLADEFMIATKLRSGYKFFSKDVSKLLKDVIEAYFIEGYFYDEIVDSKEKLNILKNTSTNFNQIDRVELDETLLKDLEITKEKFQEVFDSVLIQNSLNILCETLIDVNIGKLIIADTLFYDFALLNERTKGSVEIKYCAFENTKEASLLYFTKGVLDAIVVLVIVQVLMEKNSDVKSRVLKRLNNYEKHAKPAYLSAIKYLKFFVDRNANHNIVLLVYIARALCLSKEEAKDLSHGLRLNHKGRLLERFDDFYEAISPNYKYIK